MPTAGAVVITGSSAPEGPTGYTRRLVLSPPADWAAHDGRCEVVNTTYGYSETVACSATSVDVYVEMNNNRFVVRAYAADASRSVESAARNVRGPREPRCGKVYCVGGGKVVELSPAEQPIHYGQAGAGLGLLVVAVLLRVVRRQEKGDTP